MGSATAFFLQNFDTFYPLNLIKCSFSKYIVRLQGAYTMNTQKTTAEAEKTLSTADKPKRYHPTLIALHWLVVILIFSNFVLAQAGESEREGFEGSRGALPQSGLVQQGNPSPQSFDADEAPQGFSPEGSSAETGSPIIFHMIIGVSILVLLVIRLIVRWITKRPDWASTGNKLFDWVGGLTHFGLYLLTFGMTITGIILANQRGVLAQVFGIGSTPTPGGFGRGQFSLGMFHGAIWTLLLLLILLHIGAALYHQFILKDNLLGRMWFGKKNE